jgi:hypothetical protein
VDGIDRALASSLSKKADVKSEMTWSCYVSIQGVVLFDVVDVSTTYEF